MVKDCTKQNVLHLRGSKDLVITNRSWCFPQFFTLKVDILHQKHYCIK